jgi:hypothetical protein
MVASCIRPIRGTSLPLHTKHYQDFRLLPEASRLRKLLGILIAFDTIEFSVLPNMRGN